MTKGLNDIGAAIIIVGLAVVSAYTGSYWWGFLTILAFFSYDW